MKSSSTTYILVEIFEIHEKEAKDDDDCKPVGNSTVSMLQLSASLCNKLDIGCLFYLRDPDD